MNPHTLINFITAGLGVAAFVILPKRGFNTPYHQRRFESKMFSTLLLITVLFVLAHILADVVVFTG